MTLVAEFRKVGLLAVLAAGTLVLGCDQVSRPEATQPPSVSELTVTPDSATSADLIEAPGSDSTAPVPLAIGATATDADGTVDRVVFTIEPSSNPRRTISGILQPQQGTRYRAAIGYPVRAFQDEVYTIRVYAVDDDSLASNQSLGRFRFMPDA